MTIQQELRIEGKRLLDLARRIQGEAPNLSIAKLQPGAEARRLIRKALALYDKAERLDGDIEAVESEEV